MEEITLWKKSDHLIPYFTLSVILASTPYFLVKNTKIIFIENKFNIYKISLQMEQEPHKPIKPILVTDP